MHDATDPTSGHYAQRRRAERRRYPAVLAIALGVSGLIHLVTLLTISFEVPERSGRGSSDPPQLVDVSPVMRAYDLVTVDTEVPPIETQIEERQLLREVERSILSAPAAAVPSFRPPTERFPSAPVRERLRYREGSIRDVWRPAPPARAGELSPAEKAETRIATTLAPYNDSIAAEAAARERATDWTTTDSQGRRWGVTPDAIYLGSVVIPTQQGSDWTGEHLSPMGRREEYAQRIRDFNEIRRQAALVEGRDVFDDRVRAIRERMDAERRARMAGDTTGGARPTGAAPVGGRIPPTEGR